MHLQEIDDEAQEGAEASGPGSGEDEKNRLGEGAGSALPIAPEKSSGERVVLKYRNPMNPEVFSDRPMKDPMGMDYVPVYADEVGEGAEVPDHAEIRLTEARRQLIGVRTGEASIGPVLRTFRLPGSLGGEAGTVLAQALEMDGPKLRTGQKAEILVPGEPPRAASIVGVDRALDAYSRTYGVRLSVQPSGGDPWRPGAFCEVRISLEAGNGVSVPKDAVLSTGENSWVFVARTGDIFEPRAVEVGAEGDTLVAIRKGVSAGERVVTSAHFLIDSESRFEAAARSFR
jgi:hypothetical protein